MQVNGRRSRAFAIERSVRQSCPLSPLLYGLTLEPLLCRLRGERTRPALCGITLTSSVRAKISALADVLTVFVSRRLDMIAVKMVIERYEKVPRSTLTRAKVCSWVPGSGASPSKEPFRCSDGPIRNLLERNWLEVRAKVEAQVVAWLRRRLSLKSRAEVCAGYIFPLILYRLSVLPLPKENRLALQRSLSKLLWKGAIRWSVDRFFVSVHAMGVWGCRISRATGSLRDWLTCVTLCGRPAKQTIPLSVLARNQTKGFWNWNLAVSGSGNGRLEEIWLDKGADRSWRRETERGSRQWTPEQRGEAAWHEGPATVKKIESRCRHSSCFVEFSLVIHASVCPYILDRILVVARNVRYPSRNH